MNMLKKLFDAGALTKATVLEQPMRKGFVVEVFLQNGQREFIEHCKTKQPKIYKSIVTASNDIKKIGFKEMNISYL